MFARNGTLHVKPSQAKVVAAKFEKEILPILRNANGFRDQITMFRENDETVGISLWNDKAQLDARRVGEISCAEADRNAPFTSGAGTLATK